MTQFEAFIEMIEKNQDTKNLEIAEFSIKFDSELRQWQQKFLLDRIEEIRTKKKFEHKTPKECINIVLCDALKENHIDKKTFDILISKTENYKYNKELD